MSTTDKALALRGLAQELGRRRDFAAAIETFEEYLQINGHTAANLLAYADLLLLARKPDAARRAVDEAMAAGSDLSAAHLIAARCARLEGDYDKARKHVTTAVEKRPAFGDAWQLRLEIESADDLPELAQACAGLAEDTSVRPRERVLLAIAAGRAFEKLGNFPRAFALFDKGKKLQRRDQAMRGVHYRRDQTEVLAARARAAHGGESADQSEPAAQPIFIVGMPRSGTTLVERILGGLAGVTLGGESEAIGAIATQYHASTDRGERPDPNRLAAEYWRREQIGPCRRTDKMPHNFWHVGLIARMFPAAPVIYLRRDPRDVCMSIFSRVFSDGHPYATDFETLAHFYHVSADLMSYWQEIHAERILEVRYEELIDHPEQRTQQLAAHCGLEWLPECLDFHERIETSFTYSEMQVREPLNRKGIGAWRRYERQLAPLVAALDGYGLLSN